MSWGGGGSFGGGGGGSFGGGSMGGRSFDSFAGVHNSAAVSRQEGAAHEVLMTSTSAAGNKSDMGMTQDGQAQHAPDKNDTGHKEGDVDGPHLAIRESHEPEFLHWQNARHDQMDARSFLDEAYPEEVYGKRLKKHAFRLLRLSKGPNGSPQVSLEEFKSFARCPPYAALSWHWGTDSLAYYLAIQNYDVDIAVKSSCYEMLWHLSRNSSQSQYYWIDAVCINQRDAVEKAQQVGMMGHIYSQADHVVGYVGASDQSSQAFFSRARISDCSTAHDAKFLLQFMERKWFKRSWVIQEVLLAERIVLQAGSESLEWRKFERYYNTITNTDSTSGLMAAAQTQNLIQLRRWYINQVSTVLAPMRKEIVRAGVEDMKHDLPPIGGLEFSQLYNLMQRTWSYGATLQRDKVYAILSLFSEPFPTRLQPDYRRAKKSDLDFKKSDEQVFATLSLFMLKHCDCHMWSIGWRHVWREQIADEQDTVLRRARSTLSSIF